MVPDGANVFRGRGMKAPVGYSISLGMLGMIMKLSAELSRPILPKSFILRVNPSQLGPILESKVPTKEVQML